MSSDQLTNFGKGSGDRRLLRWAGLSGIACFVMNILSLVAGLFAPPLFVAAGPTCGPACYVDAALSGFPSVKVAIIVENALYFAAIVLLVMFFVGLYRTLGVGTSRVPASFGVGLSLLGLSMEFVGSLSVVAFAHLSEIYRAAGPQDQGTLILVSHGVQAVFNTTDTVGGILLVAAFVMFGAAMIENSASFGRNFGLATIVMSFAALAGISFFSIVADNPNDPFFVILFLVLPLILGVKLYRLARSQ